MFHLDTIYHKLNIKFHPNHIGNASSSKYLNLVSFNIQAGINTHAYRHYVTKSWQHILPYAKRIKNLDRIAHLIEKYDIIALQEADGGSLRSGFINQVEYLARHGKFPFWYQQLNRNLGKLAQPSNGLLSRRTPIHIEDHKLPGVIPGRGAIVTHFGQAKDPLVLVLIHLSLGGKAQDRQLSYIRDLIADYRYIILMGDMNSHLDRLLIDSPLQDTNLHSSVKDAKALHTFPSWQPMRSIDHILVSPNLPVKKLEVLNYPISDHLPIAMQIELPKQLLNEIHNRPAT